MHPIYLFLQIRQGVAIAIVATAAPSCTWAMDAIDLCFDSEPGDVFENIFVQVMNSN